MTAKRRKPRRIYWIQRKDTGGFVGFPFLVRLRAEKELAEWWPDNTAKIVTFEEVQRGK